MYKKILLPIFLLTMFIFHFGAYSQSGVHYGIRYSTSYTNKALHYIPALSFEYKRHNLYAGSHYSCLKKIINGDPVDKYEKEAFGINLGYRYYSDEQFKNFKIFGQFDFLIYQFKYKEYQLGPPVYTRHKKLIVENTASIGAQYTFKRFHLFTGAGIGSYDGFFLMINEFTPNCYLGIEYELK